MAITKRATTAEELYWMPDDGHRYELVRGELRQTTPAGFNHGVIVANLTLPLAQHVRAYRLGVACSAGTGFHIASDPDTVRAPDIAFVRRERIPASGRTEKFWRGAPDLAVEVLSPDDTVYETDEKVAAWLEAGAHAVWVVDPKRRTVTIYRAEASRTLAESQTLGGDDVVPGFRVAVAEIFAE